MTTSPKVAELLSLARDAYKSALAFREEGAELESLAMDLMHAEAKQTEQDFKRSRVLVPLVVETQAGGY